MSGQVNLIWVETSMGIVQAPNLVIFLVFESAGRVEHVI